MAQRLKIEIISASGLPAADPNGKSDPYVKFHWRGQKYKTDVQEKTLNPKWNAVFVVDYSATKDKVLTLEIWDWDRFGKNDPLGKVVLDLQKLSLSGPSDGNYPVQALEGTGSGILHVRLSAVVPKSQIFTQQQQQQQPQQLQQPFPQQQYQYLSQQSSQGPYPYPSQPNYAYPPPPYISHPSGSPVPPPYGYQPQGPPMQGYPPPVQGYPPPAQGYPPPVQGYPPPVQGCTSYHTPQSFSDDPIASIHEIFPHESDEAIRNALEKFNGDKEQAIDYLLNHQIAEVAHSTESPHPPSGHQTLGYFGQTGPTPQDYANPYMAIVNQAAPPMTWMTPSSPYGLHQAAHHVADLSTIYSGQGRKKALLIGINYRGTRAELRGCISDVQRMKSVLVGIYGFPDFPEAIVTLTEDANDWRYKPTRQNMLYAMGWLVKDARPGDVFFFHFSGHGAQKPNLDGTEEDGLDETILPLDFKENGVIKDDDIHRLLVESLPNGCRLTAVMDCCHSGTGMDLPFVWDSEHFEWEEDYCPFYTQGDVQLFSGCSDAQVSADVQSNKGGGFCGFGGGVAGGAMTTAFISAVTANPFGHSYPSLLAHIRKSLIGRGFKRQRPQLSSSQRFHVSRPFNLTDIVPNHNEMLGRQMKRAKRRRKPEDAASSPLEFGGQGILGGGGFGGGGFMGLLGGLAGGILLSELLD